MGFSALMFHQHDRRNCFSVIRRATTVDQMFPAEIAWGFKLIVMANIEDRLCIEIQRSMICF